MVVLDGESDYVFPIFNELEAYLGVVKRDNKVLVVLWRNLLKLFVFRENTFFSDVVRELDAEVESIGVFFLVNIQIFFELTVKLPKSLGLL